MDERKSVRCEGDVRKLTHSFETLACISSPDVRKNSEIINQNGSTGSDTKSRGDVPCKQCYQSHAPNSVCPPRPCFICDKFHKDYRSTCFHCPYEEHLPRGATFHPGYEIVCCCGNAFNEEKWACTHCILSIPVVQIKYCDICNVFGQHGIHECPKDPVLAAEYKLARDEILSREPAPPIKFDIPSSEVVYTPSIL